MKITFTTISRNLCLFLISLTACFQNVYSQSGEVCFASATKPDIVNAKSTWTIDVQNQTVTIRTTLAKTFVDNTYGTNIIGWPGTHKFSDLTGSDKLQLALYDAANVKKMEFAMDYLSSSAAAPSGYKSLGVSGGDGSMILGSAANVVSVTTSLDKNFNVFGYVLTTNSPLTNNLYAPNATYPNWIYEVWYEVTVKLSAFPSGFGKPLMTGVHASPSKTGSNSELVNEVPCPVLTAVAVGQNVGCGTTCTGSIDLTITNGKQPYSIVWADGPTTEDRQNLCPGTYNVTVTDANGSQANASATISGPPAKCSDVICYQSPTIPDIVNAKITWVINPDQTVTIRTTFAKTFVDNTYGTGAIGWPGGHTFSNLTGSDKLQLALYDGSNTKKMEFAMDYISAKAVPSGYGSLGVTGGDGSMILGNASDILSVVTSLDKNFNDFGYIQTVNSPTTDALYTPNPAFPNWIYDVWYEVKVKLSAFGPGGVGTPLITSVHASPSKTGNNTEIVIPGPCPELTAIAVGQNVGCGTTCTGSINLTITNGKQPYTIEWADGPTTEDRANLCPGTYNVKVTDANGSVANAQAIITGPPGNCTGDVCFASPTIPDIVNAKIKWVINPDQTITIRTTFAKTFVDNTYGTSAIGWPGGHSFSNLTGSDKLQLALYDGTNTKKLEFAMDYLSANAAAPSGYSSLGVGGGDGSMITGNASDILSVVTSLDQNFNLYNYVLTTNSPVTNNLYAPNATYPNWIYEVWYEVKIKMSAFGPSGFGSPLIASVHASPSKTGNNTEIVLPIPCPQASIGNYVWYDNNKNGVQDNGETGVQGVTVKLYKCSDNSLVNTMVTDVNGLYLFTGLEPGDYYIVFDKTTLPAGYIFTGKDQGGDDTKDSDADLVTGKTVCETLVDQETNLTYDAGIYKLCSVEATDSHVDVKCFNGNDGTVTVTFSGGTPPYQINFNNGGFAAQTSPKTYTGLSAGTYSWIVKDAFDCTQQGSETVGQPTVIEVTDTHVDAKCFGGSDGSVTITFSGGTPPYQINFNGGGFVTQVSPKTYTGLIAGTYSWIVKDANGCTKEGSEDVGQPPVITATDSHENTKCFGSADGTVTITFSGGTPPYQINFNGGGFVTQVSPKTYTGLIAGTYSWIVKDANGCTKEGSEDVGQPPVITATDSHVDAKCFGSADGTVTITFSGGTPPYQINFNGGGFVTQVSPKIYTGLIAGTYSWIIKDANGCTKEGSEDVGQPPVVTATDSHVDAKCFGSADGSVTITFGGGTPPYQINFNGGGFVTQVSPKTYSNLLSGSYTWIVKDANGCTKEGSEDVGQPPVITATDTHLDAKCFGSADGSVTITFSGGTPPYQINFNGGGFVTQVSPKTYSNLPSGTYSWIVKDANGCIKEGSEDVGQPPVITVTDSHADAKCFGSADGSVTITFSGGTPPYQINFNGGGFVTQVSPKTYSNLPSGTYSWIVKDANGCTKEGSEDVGQPQVITATDTHVDAKCFGSADGSVTITFSGGTPPYQINFNGGGFVSQVSPKTYSNLPSGSYTWIVKDANGCIKEGSEDVGQPPVLTASDSHVDVKCFGNSDGSVTITFGGGTPPYQINFNGGGFIAQTSPKTYTNLPFGTYGWIVKDANGCTQSGSEDVGQPPVLTASDSHVDVKCFGNSDGSVTITFGGGTPPYQINFNGGGFIAQTSPKTYTNLPFGTYGWIVKDANGCTQSGSEDVGQPPVLTASDSHVDVKCFGNSDGSVTITFGGGTPPYQINFNGGGFVAQTSPKTYTNLPFGTYGWIVKDANGCTQSGSEDVGQPPVLTASDSHVDVKCFGNSDGSVTITFGGGTPPYQINFNGGGFVAQTSPKTYTNLPFGTYGWIVKDANGCTQSGSEDVGQPPVIIATDSHVDAKCFGSADGSVTITFSGGTPPYQINFNGGGFVTQTSPKTYTNLPFGTYSWIVKDANGCTKEGSEDVGQPPVITATDSHVDAKCFGSADGTVTITFSGGTPPYQINFNGGGFVTQVSPKTYTGLIAGTYSWIVKDANGCTQSGSEDVGQPPVITATDSHVDAKCFGSADGTVTITFSGGTPPYQINFNGGGFVTQVSPKTYTGLIAGTYSWIVKDANGCTKEGSEDVGQPPVITATDSHVDAKCFGSADGTLTITFSGGTPPYQINFNGGGFVTQVSPKTYTGLIAGTYSWIVKDANGCTQSGSEDVGQPPVITATDSHVDAKCFGSADGTVTITFSGGTPPYQINFNGGGFVTQVSPKTYTGLIAGTYSWIVKDANGCTKEGSEDVGQPPVITATDSHVDAKCFGSADGTVTITFSGGTPPYQINFNGGGFVTQVSPKTYTGLIAGTYSWVVKDANGCTKEGSEDVGQPPVITATDSHVDAKCFGSADGTVTITFSGGTPPYQINFNGGGFVTQVSPKTYTGLIAGTYSWIVKDANGCTKEGSEDVGQPPVITATDSHVDAKCFGSADGTVTITFSGGTPPYQINFNGGGFVTQVSPKTYTGLIAGTYSWIVKDANGCTKEGSEDVGQPPVITATDSHVDAKCFGSADGTVTITFSGGTPPYQINFNGGGFVTQVSPKTYTGLIAGTYSWIVKDANGCTQSGSEDVGQPPVITATDSHVDAKCFGSADGTVTITFSGGTPPYQINFNGGGFVTQVSPKTYTGLIAGTYSWIVKDANGCTQSGSEDVGQPPVITATDSHVDAKCFGSADGTVTITFSGGTPPYQINFNGGGFVTQVSPKTYTGLIAGTYSWIVKDANGCTKEGSEDVGQPPVITATDSHVDAKCFGSADGTVTITFSGGTPPYQVNFNGGGFVTQVSPKTYTGLIAGTYSWIVKDANGCTQSGSEDVGQPPVITATDSHVDAKCFGSADGTVTITFSGGTPPYQINFNGGGFVTQVSPKTYTGLIAGTYSWIVKDANGCTKEGSEDVGQPPVITATDSHVDAKCFGSADGTVTITFSGGTPPYQVNFNGGGFVTQVSPKTYTGLIAGTYSWIVKDANGCTKEGSEDVGQPSVLVATDSHVDVSCSSSTGSVTINFSGGTGPYQVNFNNTGFVTQTSPKTYSGLAAGTYPWIVKDANGCMQEGSETIIQSTTLIASDGHVNVKCFGGSDGSVTVTFSGGAPPYQVNFNGGGFVTQVSPKTYTGLIAGTYSWVVMDASGCTQSGSEEVTQPTELIASDGHECVKCYNGSDGTVTITFSGGTPPYQVNFNNTGFVTQTSPKTYTGLVAGTYPWVVKDANGCMKSGSEDVCQPSPFGATSTKSDVTCNGANDGCIFASAFGGTPPYSYALGAVTNNTGTFCKLAPGLYNIIVTDASGCTTSTQQSISQPNSNNCNNNTIVVDQNVTIDFNTNPPTYTGEPDLLPYYSFVKSGVTPNTWQAVFTLGANKLLIKNGATITTTKVNGYAPGIEITGSCDMEIENGGKIIVQSTNQLAGDIDVEMNGSILVNGVVHNEVTGTLGLPGHITMVSKTGNFTEGQTGLIQILGIDPGANVITLQTCGSECGNGDIVISGLVKDYAHAHSGDLTLNRPVINVISLNGAVTVNANTTEPLYDEFASAGGLYDIYGGLLSWVRDNVNPGSVKVQAKKDITVNGHGTDPTGSVRTSFGAIAAIATASSSPGGLIDVRSIEGKIIASNRAFDVGGKNLLATNFAYIRLHAKGNIELSRPGASNTFNPVVNSSSPSSGGKGGTNELRSFSGSIIIGANALVNASVPAGGGSVQGINLLTSCTGVNNSGTVTPADLVPGDDINTCNPAAPTPLFVNCISIANQRTISNPVSIINTLDNIVNTGNRITVDFTAYPNPTTGVVTVRFVGKSLLKTEIKISDAAGRRTFVDHMFNTIIGNNYYSLDLSNYPSGVYMILLRNNNKQYLAKIIKQ